MAAPTPRFLGGASDVGLRDAVLFIVNPQVRPGEFCLHPK